MKLYVLRVRLQIYYSYNYESLLLIMKISIVHEFSIYINTKKNMTWLIKLKNLTEAKRLFFGLINKCLFN